MILDKANEDVIAYPVIYEDDGYGGKTPKADLENPVTFRAFCIPVGFSGAGWAINSKLQAQGFAEVARVRVITKPVNGVAPSARWAHLDFQGRRWTIQEDPRLIKGLRRQQDVVVMTVELMGDAT